jgi:hypothetical protein
VPNPDDPNPLLPFHFVRVAGFQFDSATDVAVAFDANLFRFIPVEDGGQANGSVDLDLTLTFVPVAGRTYTIAAALTAQTGDGDSSVDFDSSGEVTRIVLPPGVSLGSAAGASWNTVVPEPGLASLLTAGGLALAWVRRRS